MRIGIYGGTFSPVHNGHVAAARAFMEQMWLDILYVIPTGISPHKKMEGDASDADRLEMCRLAFSDVEGVIVSDLEMRREGKSYTVDTLREMYDPENRLFLLIGTDMMLTLGQWREPAEIFRLCYPVYVRREADPALDEQIVARIAEYYETYGRVVRRITTPPIEVSSSEIRAAISEGRTVADLVPPAVETYIRDKGLYRRAGDVAIPAVTMDLPAQSDAQTVIDKAPWGESDLRDLRESLRDKMSEKRYLHTVAVEDMAARLCAVYCPEETNFLRAAALLHDITKELDAEAQLAICRDHNIAICDDDRMAPKTFHARTAAALIPEQYSTFGHETVVSAVRYHTTGRGGMTLTEKLLYLADYIDESRKFPDCVRLRDFFWNASPERMSEEDRLAHLRRTLMMSFEMTVRALLCEDAVISIDTMEARNELCREEKAANVK